MKAPCDFPAALLGDKSSKTPVNRTDQILLAHLA